ncbi:YbjN domain-containing protein [Avibacterium paragallinarum]|uniref:YbjN domain-containing protein n=1 Tax=Avibacterium paragallinarum TaxID=728 RepID=UPI002ED98903
MSNQYTAEEIKEILLDEGYRSVTIVKEDIAALKVNGNNYLIALYENGDIQLVYVVAIPMLSLEKVNDWNANHRLGCLYIDEANNLSFSITLPALGERLSKARIVKGISSMLNAVRTIDIFEFVED